MCQKAPSHICSGDGPQRRGGTTFLGQSLAEGFKGWCSGSPEPPGQPDIRRLCNPTVRPGKGGGLWVAVGELAEALTLSKGTPQPWHWGHSQEEDAPGPLAVPEEASSQLPSVHSAEAPCLTKLPENVLCP